MRVLSVVTNVFFLLSIVVRVYAGDKRVIIRVPQRIKHIYHHQVKKVPVYVLLPADQKKSKVLDDLQQVTKALPCKERESAPASSALWPWPDDNQDDNSATFAKYRYARHYNEMRGSTNNAALDDDVYDGYATKSIRQQGATRLLQTRQPPPSPPPPARSQRHKNQYQTVTVAAGDFDEGDSGDGGYADYARHNRGDVDGIGGRLNSLSRVTYAPSFATGPSFSWSTAQTQSTRPISYKTTDDRDHHHRQRQRHHRSSVATLVTSASADANAQSAVRWTKKSAHRVQTGAGNGSDRTRYARYSREYKNEQNHYHRDNGGDGTINKANKLISMEMNDGGGGGDVEQNLIRISYPPSATATVTAAHQLPFSHAAADYRTTDAATATAAAAADADAASHHSSDYYSSPSNRHHYQHELQQQPAEAAANNYASSYQYRIQH